MDEMPRLLIVEDDPDLSEMLSAFFRVEDYMVYTALTGADALQISQQQTLSLIILDIRLPDIDGYEICRQLRTNRQTQDTPIIFLTEKRDRYDKLQGLELGVVDYITKPFDIQELQLRVRNAINRAAQQSVTNPVTELPEGPPVTEQLDSLRSQQHWAALVLHVRQLSAFRELYGFVAADDVLRAIALMIRNAVREHSHPEDFIGHLENEAFLIITNADTLSAIRSRLEARWEQSREYFYPIQDRQRVREGVEVEYLQLHITSLSDAAGPFNSVDELLTALADTAATG